MECVECLFFDGLADHCTRRECAYDDDTPYELREMEDFQAPKGNGENEVR